MKWDNEDDDYEGNYAVLCIKGECTKGHTYLSNRSTRIPGFQSKNILILFTLFSPNEIGSEYAGNEFIRPYFGFTRAGSRMYSNLDDGSSQETIKRSGPGGGAGTWFV